jgi:uncharacterized protein (DUF1330 family)/ribosomal protein S18 acetylase RimI-like enzyme
MMGCYFIANIRVTDESTYQKYLDACDAVFAKYGGKYVAVDASPRVLEGNWNYSRAVVIHFKSEAAFDAWYGSSDYQAILKHRLAGAVCDTILVRDLAGGPVVKRVSPNDPDFLGLVGELNAELRTMYPVLQDAYDKLNVLPPDALVALLYDEGHPVACGCLKKIGDAEYELKRMFVAEPNRGKGYSKIVLEELEGWALEKGGREILLETGIKQTAAIALYKKRGYIQTENYGEYRGNSNSLCMKKELRPVDFER